MFAKSNQVERNHTPHQQLKHKAMKKAILFTLIVVGLATIMYQQNEVNKLKKQLNATEQVFNQVYADNEDYFIDVLSETDVYQSYLETL